jgi:hypothetical protein
VGVAVLEERQRRHCHPALCAATMLSVVHATSVCTCTAAVCSRDLTAAAVSSDCYWLARLSHDNYPQQCTQCSAALFTVLLQRNVSLLIGLRCAAHSNVAGSRALLWRACQTTTTPVTLPPARPTSAPARSTASTWAHWCSQTGTCSSQHTLQVRSGCVVHRI